MRSRNPEPEAWSTGIPDALRRLGHLGDRTDPSPRRFLAWALSTFLLLASSAEAQTPHLVRDIHSGSAGSDPARLTAAGGKVFFTAFEPATGTELWTSDGTEAGTTLVADLLPGPASPEFYDFTDADGRFFFRTWYNSEYRLWTSDGTAAGTVHLATIEPNALGPAGSFDLEPGAGGLYFTNRDEEIWHTDGTVAGTVPITTIPGAWYCHFEGCGYFPVEPDNFRNVNGTLFFVVGPASASHQLWMSDGTDAGTVPVVPYYFASTATELTNVNGTLFFSAPSGLSSEPWKSDGTEPGTAQIADINPGYPGSDPAYLTTVGSVVYFSAAEPVAGRELWKSDGSVAGTTLVADVNAGPGDSAPMGLTRVGATLFFRAFEPLHGAELWKTDGTPGGTTLVSDIAPGAASSDPADLVAIDDLLYFSASSPDGGRELWKSDGTNTVRLAEIWPGATGSNPTSIANFAGTPFFAATAPDTGTELWAAGCSAGPGAPDIDGDGQCDADDPCTNIASGQDFSGDPAPRIALSRINTDTTPGDDRLTFAATFALASGASFADLDLLVGGARMIITSDSGTRTPIDVVLASGAYTGRGTRGWVHATRRRVWTFHDRTAAPANGITRMRVRDFSAHAPRLVRILVSGRDGIYDVTEGDEPLAVVVILGDDAQGALGLCGEGAFPPGACLFNHAGDRLRCQ